MQVLVVDDEPLARQRLVRLLQNTEHYAVAGEAENGARAVAAVESLDPDIVLMDVRMPGDDGITAAKKIALLSEPPAIIFCTAYDEYALEAFQTMAAGYVVKPVQAERLEAALENASKTNKLQKAALNSVDDNNPKARTNISTKTRKGLELIPVSRVHCFVADHKYVTVYHDGGEAIIDDTLKELEEEFRGRFVRVHRNSLVSVASIEGMERVAAGNYEIKLKSLDYRPVVSRRHVARVRELLTRL